ncbi:phage portal protein [Paucibacter sp. DJ1R-11]|uniref:phage portal protein n=1 Tax=Paucibacter sp. DJ1R-11 TaxID=2893556 RepID=UPI0021E4BA51|nr:phage portal protein [Paucibacter sp. DJ1R-11]MCV2365539.1 phage portal protein [Paucibacter sp. DJ1R-11]
MSRAFVQATQPTVLDRLIGWVSPGAGLQRHHSRQLLTRAYAAALPGDTWRPKRPNASANADHAADAPTLRAKSRSLIQNVEYIAAGMNARVAHIVGTGIIPKWGGRHGNVLADLWPQWVKVADADGRRDLYGIQAAGVRAMDADGEVLIRLRSRRMSDGLPVPLQLQLLEIDHLDTTITRGNGNNAVVGGCEVDALGKVVAYWLWPQHPGDQGQLRQRNQRSTRVPAAEIIHLFAPTRPGQGRGFPRLSSVIPRARDLQLLEDAELQRKNLEGRLSVLASGDVAGMAEGAQYSGGPGAGASLGELASGGITQIPAGMNVTVIEPKAAPGFVDYCKYNIHLICAGAGFTYEQATGDMREVNFSSARVRLLDFRREIEQLQWLTVIPQLCERICAEFAAYAALAGVIQGKLDYTVEHSTPKWDHVNPSQDVDADLAEIAGGLSSISEKLRRRGYDPKQVFDELAEDIKGLQERGIWDALVMLLKGKVPAQPSPNGG